MLGQCCAWGSRMFWGGHWGFMGMFFWLLVIVGVGMLFYTLAKNKGTTPPSVPLSSITALETLKMRYAKGEIDDEEYARRKKELES